MNKTELVDTLSAKTGSTKVETTRFVDALVETVGEVLTDGGEIALVGFGTFKTAQRAAKAGRNPTTGARVEIPARRVAVFKPGKGLKDKVA